jgi:hypothetical protein
MASLLASIKIIFVETAIPFCLWSIIQFLTYSSSFGHLGAHEREIFLLLSALMIKYQIDNYRVDSSDFYFEGIRIWAKTPAFSMYSWFFLLLLGLYIGSFSVMLIGRLQPSFQCLRIPRNHRSWVKIVK